MLNNSNTNDYYYYNNVENHKTVNGNRFREIIILFNIQNIITT